ncbi:MAG: sulfatase-like hydrolase/transferase [Planctomycetota bacterium]
MIVTDQQRADAIAALGNSIIRTPHVDRLALGGTAFRPAYAPCPVCAPARLADDRRSTPRGGMLGQLRACPGGPAGRVAFSQFSRGWNGQYFAADGERTYVYWAADRREWNFAVGDGLDLGLIPQPGGPG